MNYPALPSLQTPLQGDYGLQVVARGPDGSELACVNVAFSLVLPSTSRSSSSRDSGSSSGSRGAEAEAEAGVVVEAADAQLGRKQRMGKREVA
jgi:hypothetical protein